MRGIIRNIIINFISLFIVAQTIKGIDYSQKILVLFWASFYLSLFNLVIKPLLNLLLMPINLITLGAFKWIINVIVLFLVTFFVAEFRIVPSSFPGLSLGGIVIPAFTLSFFWTLILISFIIEALALIFSWLLK